MPPVASTVASAARISMRPSGRRTRAPQTRWPTVTRSSAAPTSTWIEGVRRTVSTSARMMAAPAPSPPTRAMRRCEWAASRDWIRRPAASRSNGTPKPSRSSMPARASRARSSAAAASTRPAPAATVSAAWLSAESSSPRAAATPPWAQTDEAPSPRGAAVRRVTGDGASFRAQNSPARPPPMTRTRGDDMGTPSFPAGGVGPPALQGSIRRGRASAGQTAAHVRRAADRW